MKRKTTSLKLTEEERNALQRIGGGTMRRGVSKLIRLYCEKEGKEELSAREKLILPSDPLLTKIYERIIHTSVPDEDGIYRLDLDVVMGDISSVLRIPKSKTGELIRKLVDRRFARINQGIRNVTIVLKPEYKKTT